AVIHGIPARISSQRHASSPTGVKSAASVDHAVSAASGRSITKNRSPPRLITVPDSARAADNGKPALTANARDKELAAAGPAAPNTAYRADASSIETLA